MHYRYTSYIYIYIYQCRHAQHQRLGKDLLKHVIVQNNIHITSILSRLEVALHHQLHLTQVDKCFSSIIYIMYQYAVLLPLSFNKHRVSPQPFIFSTFPLVLSLFCQMNNDCLQHVVNQFDYSKTKCLSLSLSILSPVPSPLLLVTEVIKQ